MAQTSCNLGIRLTIFGRFTDVVGAYNSDFHVYRSKRSKDAQPHPLVRGSQQFVQHRPVPVRL